MLRKTMPAGRHPRYRVDGLAVARMDAAKYIGTSPFRAHACDVVSWHRWKISYGNLRAHKHMGALLMKSRRALLAHVVADVYVWKRAGRIHHAYICRDLKEKGHLVHLWHPRRKSKGYHPAKECDTRQHGDEGVDLSKTFFHSLNACIQKACLSHPCASACEQPSEWRACR